MKIGHVFVAVLLSCMIIGTVSAENFTDYNVTAFNESTEVSIGGCLFTIPEGFGSYDDKNATSNLPDLGSDQNYKFYINEDGDMIHIIVVHDFLGMSLDDIKVAGANKTTINGKEGWSYDEDDLHYFSYVEGDNAIYIGVNNQSRIGDVIK